MRKQRSITPSDKVNRYLHRIEQLVNTRNRTPSPINSRLKHSQNVNTLDSYLKYELSCKIINNFTQKYKHKTCILFFNSLRSFESVKMQKIYRFISIQKQQCSHMKVDPNISAKIMCSVLKNIYKNFITRYFKIFIHFSENCSDSKNSKKLSIMKQQKIVRTIKSQKRPLQGCRIILQFIQKHHIIVINQLFNKLKAMKFEQKTKNYASKLLILTLHKIYLQKFSNIFIILTLQRQQIIKKDNNIKKSNNSNNKNQCRQIFQMYYHKLRQRSIVSIISIIHTSKNTRLTKTVSTTHSLSNIPIKSKDKFVFIIKLLLIKRINHTFYDIKNFTQMKIKQECLKNLSIKIFSQIIKKLQVKQFSQFFLSLKQCRLSNILKIEKLDKSRKRVNENKQFLGRCQKLRRLMILLNKLLLPLRQAFQAIDQSAYYYSHIKSSAGSAFTRIKQYAQKNKFNIKTNQKQKSCYSPQRNLSSFYGETSKKKLLSYDDLKILVLINNKIVLNILTSYVKLKIFNKSHSKIKSRQFLITQDCKQFLQQRQQIQNQFQNKFQKIKFMTNTANNNKIQNDMTAKKTKLSIY